VKSVADEDREALFPIPIFGADSVGSSVSTGGFQRKAHLGESNYRFSVLPRTPINTKKSDTLATICSCS
jgi:hypothetical protein